MLLYVGEVVFLLMEIAMGTAFHVAVVYNIYIKE